MKLLENPNRQRHKVCQFKVWKYTSFRFLNVSLSVVGSLLRELCAFYRAWILSHYQMYNVQVFSSAQKCLFVLMLVSFTVQKLFSLIQLHLFIFAFVYFAVGKESPKTSLTLVLWSIFTCILQFLVSHPFLSSLFYIVFIVVYFYSVVSSYMVLPT